MKKLDIFLIKLSSGYTVSATFESNDAVCVLECRKSEISGTIKVKIPSRTRLDRRDDHLIDSVNAGLRKTVM